MKRAKKRAIDRPDIEANKQKNDILPIARLPAPPFHICCPLTKKRRPAVLLIREVSYLLLIVFAVVVAIVASHPGKTTAVIVSMYGI